MRAPTSRRGLTLLELLIALAISAVLIAAFFEILSRVRSGTDSGIAEAEMLGDADALIHRIADELRPAGLSSPDWQLGDGGRDLIYNRSLGSVDGEMAWEGPRSLATLPLEEPGETSGSNGADDNGNGLVDERRLVLRDPGNLEVLETLSACLTADGLLFELEERRLTITVTLQAPAGKPGSPPVTTRASTDVSLRN